MVFISIVHSTINEIDLTNIRIVNLGHFRINWNGSKKDSCYNSNIAK